MKSFTTKFLPLTIICMVLFVTNIQAQYQITTMAGKFDAEGAPAQQISVAHPSALALDGQGNLYIAQAKLRRVNLSTEKIYTKDANVANAVAMDAAGNIYVADKVSHRIKKIDAVTGQVTVIAGRGSSLASGDGGPALTAGFDAQSIALDSQGNIYIADQKNHRIRKIEVATGIISTVAGTGLRGFLGDGGPADVARLNQPGGIAIDANNNLFIADLENHRIRKVDAQTNEITTVAGSGISGFWGDGGGAIKAQLNRPKGLAIDANNNLYIADQGNHCIRKVDLNHHLITTIAGNSTKGFSGDGGDAVLASLDNPTDVVLDTQGNVYIADGNNHRVRKISASTGHIHTIVGNGLEFYSAGFSGDGGDALQAQFNFHLQDTKLAQDRAGHIYIADTDNQRIRKIDVHTNIITTVAGNGNQGHLGDGGLATAAALTDPTGIDIDANGDIYIAEKDHIRKVAAGTQVISTLYQGQPRDVHLDSKGHLYFIEGHQIKKIKLATQEVTLVAGTGSRGSAGDGGPAVQAQLYSPSSVALDKQGNLYISDYWNGKVRKVDGKSHLITTLISGVSLGDLAMDEEDNLYGASLGTVIKINITNGASENAAHGLWGWLNNELPLLPASLNSLVLANNGDIYLASNGRLDYNEALSNRIWKLRRAPAINITQGSTEVTPQSGFDFRGYPINTTVELDFSVENLTSATFNGESIKVIGDFALASSHPQDIDGASKVTVTISMDASSTGNKTGWLVVNDAYVIRLTGKVTADNNQEIVFRPFPNKKYGDADFQLSATASSGLLVTYTSSNTQVAVITGDMVKIIGAGSTTITAHQAGNNQYNPAPSVRQVLRVEKQEQRITFGSLSNQVYGDADFQLLATASSGLPVTYTSSNPNVAVVTGDVVKIIGVGFTTITAQQTGNQGYHPASNVSQILTVYGKDQSITFGELPDKVYGDADFQLLATASSGLPVTYISSNPRVATITGDVVKIIGVGTTLITAHQVGNEEYKPTQVEQTLKVDGKNQHIVFETLPDKTYGDPNFQLSASASSGLPVTYTSSDPNVATIQDNIVRITGIGSVTISAQQTGSQEYHPALEVRHSFRVSKGNQSISFPELSDKTYGGENFSLPATASSGLPITYVSSNPYVAIVTGNIVKIIGIGSTTITAKQPGDAYYHQASEVDQNLTVDKGVQKMTFSAFPEKAYGDASFRLSASVSTGLPVTYTSSDPTVAAVTGDVVKIIGIGETIITARQAGNEYYTASEANQPLIVNKRAQTVYLNTISDKQYGDGDFFVSANVSTGLPITYTSSEPSIAKIIGNRVEIVGVGSVTITAHQAGNRYYKAANTSQTFAVRKGSQSITFGQLPHKSYSDIEFQPTATASSGLPITYQSSNPNVAIVNRNQIQIIGIGSTIITAQQEGNAYYHPASQVTQTLTIHKGQQNITFEELRDRGYGESDFQLAATTSSGLPITYSSSNPNVAVVTGNVIKIVGIGSTIITALQKGNEYYHPATDASQILKVHKGVQNLTFSELDDRSYGDAKVVLWSESSSGLPVTYTSSDPNVVIIKRNIAQIVGVGSVTITASQAGNEYYNPVQINQTFTIHKGDQILIFEPLPDKAYGDADFQAPAIVSSGLTITYTSSDENVAVIRKNKIQIVGAGVTTITAHQEGNEFYNKAVSKSQTLNVLQRVTSLPENLDNGTLTLFPNPVQQVLNLEIKGQVKHHQIDLTFYNSQGSPVLRVTKRLQNGKVSVPVNSLSRGQYQVVIKLGEALIQQKIIKQ